VGRTIEKRTKNKFNRRKEKPKPTPMPVNSNQKNPGKNEAPEGKWRVGKKKISNRESAPTRSMMPVGKGD